MKGASSIFPFPDIKTLIDCSRVKKNGREAIKPESREERS